MNINRLECRERTIRASHDGTEIVRTFYVDPYEAHTVVLSALLGAVEPDPADATKYIRRKPATDSWFTSDFYCTDAWVEQVDQQAMAASPSLGVYPPGNYAVSDFRKFISNAGAGDWSCKETPGGITVRTRNVNDAQSTSDAGCFIRAVFKPLIHETPTWGSDVGFGANPPDPFDFVDPLLIPLTKTVSTGVGLRYFTNSKMYPWVGSEGFVTQPMAQFTIRRLMVGNPPLAIINRLKGKINFLGFDLGRFHFAAGTLRFDECEVVKRAVPYSDGTTDRLTVWYDLLYAFTHNAIYDEYYFNEDGATGFRKGFVTWNRILGCPKLPVLGMPQLRLNVDEGTLKDNPLCYYPIGWNSHLFGPYRGLYLPDENHQLPDVYTSGTPNGFHDLFNPIPVDLPADPNP
jgi:hypothetical protein